MFISNNAVVTLRCQIKFIVRVTFAQGVIPFARQCTHPPELTANIHFSGITVGHRRVANKQHVRDIARFGLLKISLMLGGKKISIHSRSSTLVKKPLSQVYS